MFTQNVLDGIRVYSLTFDTVAGNVAINVKSWSIAALWLGMLQLMSRPGPLLHCGSEGGCDSKSLLFISSMCTRCACSHKDYTVCTSA